MDLENERISGHPGVLYPQIRWSFPPALSYFVGRDPPLAVTPLGGLSNLFSWRPSKVSLKFLRWLLLPSNVLSGCEGLGFSLDYQAGSLRGAFA